MVNNRDNYNVITSFRHLALDTDDTIATFHSFSRTANTDDVGAFLDEAADDPWAVEAGYSAVTESTIEVPCTLVLPANIGRNFVQQGYHLESEIEIEVSVWTLSSYNISIADIRNTYEYITLDVPKAVDLYGNSNSEVERLYRINNVRELDHTGNTYVVRIGLKLSESDTSQLQQGAIDG